MANIYDLDEELEKQSFDFKLFKRTMRFLRPYWKNVAIISIILLGGLAIGLLDPLIVRYVVDKGMMAKDMSVILNMGGILLIINLLNLIGSRIRIKVVNKTAQSLIYDIRKETFEHIQNLSFRFFDGRPAGKIISRITNDVQAISDFINTGVVSFVSEIISILGIIVIIFVINYKLAAITVTVVPVFILLLICLKSASEKAWSETRKTMANINANMNETLQGMRVIQAFSRQKHNILKFEEINKKNYKAHMHATIIQLLSWPLVEFVGMAGTCAVVWLGAIMVTKDEVSVGTVIAFANYIWRLWSPLSALSKVYNQALSAMASSERIFHILDTEPEIVDSPDAIELEDINGTVEFINVTFGYNPEERMVLHDISFKAEPGEVVALVGPTGAGKTSIINLLMRFYDPIEGSILIDGYDIRDIKLSSMRSRVSMVLQDSFIFSGSIKENILYGKLDATEDEIINVARATKVLNFVEKFGEGFDTDVEERGAKLSSGQRQLLAFARALIADPRILILDEATSSVDTETERHIQEALKTLFKDRTSIVIAHRLSTIEHADKIIVIDDGRIIEQGTHEELLNSKGMYYELYQKQFQEYNDEAVG
ncbi:MAG TPA: ABC transporter ATP-binding protein [Clostridiaceae bacterium]|nr:ABC transporter ATP-binding protein [Clostridiaceae bacterium]